MFPDLISVILKLVVIEWSVLRFLCRLFRVFWIILWVLEFFVCYLYRVLASLYLWCLCGHSSRCYIIFFFEEDSQSGWLLKGSFFFLVEPVLLTLCFWGIWVCFPQIVVLALVVLVVWFFIIGVIILSLWDFLDFPLSLGLLCLIAYIPNSCRRSLRWRTSHSFISLLFAFQ